MTSSQLINSRKEVFLNNCSTEVKMFIHNNPKEAETSIARWLKENDVTIHHIVQSQSEKAGNFLFVVTLFYMQND